MGRTERQQRLRPCLPASASVRSGKASAWFDYAHHALSEVEGRKNALGVPAFAKATAGPP
jgi:hypothetical protein